MGNCLLSVSNGIHFVLWIEQDAWDQQVCALVGSSGKLSMDDLIGQ